MRSIKPIIEPAVFAGELLNLLEETYKQHRGYYLDKGTSLFATLEQIGWQEASVPIGNTCATLAAYVEHVIFYL